MCENEELSCFLITDQRRSTVRGEIEGQLGGDFRFWSWGRLARPGHKSLV